MQKYNIFTIYNMSARDTPKTPLKGAGCLLWIEHNGQILILTGKESRYLSDIDIHKEVSYKGEIVSVESLQKYTLPEIAQHLSLPEKLRNVKQMYGAITERIEGEIGQRIQFDTPDNIGVDQYHCNFRILLEGAKRGICKGGVKSTDATSKDTAQRELAEEAGMNISRTSMAPLGVFLGYEMFQVDLGTIMATPQASYREVLERIHSREIKKYGELFEVSLRPLDEVIGWVCNGEYNAVSRESICAFVQMRGTPEQKTRIATRRGGKGKKSRGKKSRGKKSRGKQTRSKKSRTRSKK